MQTPSENKTNIREFGIRLRGKEYIDRPGAYAVIEDNNRRIAVIETSNGYFLPGGGINPCEAEIDALKREIVEEIGFHISGVAMIGEAVEYIEALMERKYYRIHSRFYSAQIVSKIVEETEKDRRLVWLWRAEAVKLLKRQSQSWAILRSSERLR